ncbi:hypothetical protein QRB41_12945 [Mycobacterium avium subsp. hominissuis]|uniref:Uncharacterized protein n=1 Tax=Mycobacterium avium TaxID=1764 RepID=A0A2A2ZN79_MYCAV|nr:MULTISPECIES: hypothetical protein [Mycobacteriaceae]MDO2384305.1 hypothetical protein [Mycobacterium avium subsp. hominissuis]MDO2395323.1 hypothetical protein [Mycobacterium avium subsp. hominissuis]PBA27891.1 hypothetical protein CKJ66_04615 [Mycobacterium avium]RUP26124.1 MAG: hypothetical protein EKK51_30855 [Mycolicibacterium sp.]
MTIDPGNTIDQHPNPKPPNMFHRIIVLLGAATAGTVAGYFSDWESGLTVFSTIVSICTIEHRN